MQFLHSFFLVEWLDKLVNSPSRQLQATIKCPVCRTSFPVPDTDTFDNLPSSFRRDRLVEAPILGASTEEKCDTCGWNNPAVIYCSVCQRVLCPPCFKFHQRFKKSSKCFDRRSTGARNTRRDRETNCVHLFILIFIYLIIFSLYAMALDKSEKPKPGVNAVYRDIRYQRRIVCYNRPPSIIRGLYGPLHQLTDDRLWRDLYGPLHQLTDDRLWRPLLDRWTTDSSPICR